MVHVWQGTIAVKLKEVIFIRGCDSKTVADCNLYCMVVRERSFTFERDCPRLQRSIITKWFPLRMAYRRTHQFICLKATCNEDN